MNTLIRLLALLVGFAGTTHALTITFTPPTPDLNDLDHHNATSWGIATANIPAGQVITGAKIKITRIWDWRVEPNDALFIRLLDTAPLGITTYADNTGDNVVSDYFSGQGLLLTTWTDPNGGNGGANAVDLVYVLTEGQLAALRTYVGNDTLSGKAAFGFGFDPDCHYFNEGVTFEITTTTMSVPDSGTTAILLGTGLLLLGVFRRRAA